MPTPNELSGRSDGEVRRILRQRKRRNRTSCYPCQTWRVKCGRSSRCENWAKRGYPELCSFDAPGAMDTTSGPSMSSNHDLQRALDHTPQSSPLGIVSDSESHPNRQREGNNGRASGGGISVNQGTQLYATQEIEHREHGEPFLGANSMPVFLRDQAIQEGPAQNSPSQTVEDAVLPILGLQKLTSTYPFLPASQASMETISAELHQVLPVDRETIR
jgi:hypothetical protein